MKWSVGWHSFNQADKIKCYENNYYCLKWGTYSAILTNNGVQYFCGCGEE